MHNDAFSSDGQQSSIERRLATILMADVFGYSRMMGENEEQTVKTLRGHRVVFDELLKAHRGRIFNTAGDAILAEFPSAVEAVRCATEIQTALRTRNEHLPDNQRMWFRIGINLGDVIVQGGDLLGDGVNVAARIQAIAEPGGVCISGSVYDQIQNKLTLQIKEMGEKTFKNISQPIRTFAISDDAGAPRPIALRWGASRKRPIFAAAAIIVGLIGVGAMGFWLYRDYAVRTTEETRHAEDAQRNAEAQRKAELEKAAAATAQNETKLLAELQSARDALTQAEASKRKAEQERMAAEAAQREAKLQGELRAAKDAVRKAEQSEKKADQEGSAAREAVKSVETAVQKNGGPPPAVESKASSPAVAPPGGTTATAPASPVAPTATPASRSVQPQDDTHASATRGNDWVATRICQPYHEFGTSYEQLPVLISGDEFIVERGQEGRPGFMSVRGRPRADGTLTLSGKLISGAAASRGRVAGAFFEGSVVNERYELKGQIGERACTLTLERRRT
jgi:class 3 adenylate cyclase